MAQSSHKAKDATEEMSFESISELESSYRKRHSTPSTSSERSSDDSAETNDVLLTLSGAKLFPETGKVTA